MSASRLPRPSAPRAGLEGFTLLETSLAVAIAAAAALAVMSALRPPSAGRRMDDAVSSFVADLRSARARAISAGSPIDVVLDVQTRTYTRPGRSAARFPVGSVLSVTFARSRAVGAEIGGFRFYPDGGSSGGTLRVNLGGENRVVALDWLTGRATVER
ncbi:MAG: hypothetical protein KGI57_03825 [Hyphomicrobiales bacterium]|nr:hypothetical protein [Hyphomicrobiales bacterium]MDE2016816.1 hypothetical protein [Hyphomicrobiales bacterium]